MPDIYKIFKNLANLKMLSIRKHTRQLGLFGSLADQLDQKHRLYQLANKIDWPFFDDAFKKHYSKKMGKPTKPSRLIVSLLILEFVRNPSDENLVEHWAKNIYFPYFSCEQEQCIRQRHSNQCSLSFNSFALPTKHFKAKCLKRFLTLH